MLRLSQLDRVEEFLDAACREAVSRGYVLRAKHTLIGRQCCPLGAAAIAFAPTNWSYLDTKHEAEALVAEHEFFANGFDGGDGCFASNHEYEEYRLGRDFRAKYLEAK